MIWGHVWIIISFCEVQHCAGQTVRHSWRGWWSMGGCSSFHTKLHHTIPYHTIQTLSYRIIPPHHATPYWPTNKDLPAHGRDVNNPAWLNFPPLGGLNSRYNWDSLLDWDTTQAAIWFLLKCTVCQYYSIAKTGLRHNKSLKIQDSSAVLKIDKDSFPL